MQIAAIRDETFPLDGEFTISRGARREIHVIAVELREGGHRGQGECVPYAHYGETMASVRAQIEGLAPDLAAGLDRQELLARLPAGAARNAVDCALLDLAAKSTGRRAWELLELPPPGPTTTAYTLSLGPPETMAASARKVPERPLLKLKLGGDGDIERVQAVRAAAPQARLIVDANEAWREHQLAPFFAAMAAAGVELIEQPLPAGQDDALARIDRPAPVCADEACHTSDDLANLAGKYDFINIKLDKTGGLTHAVELARAGREAGFGIMVGCMLGTSLAMAPACLLAGLAAFVDLDGPLLLARDRAECLVYEGAVMLPPAPALWG